MTDLPTELEITKPDPLGHMIAWCLAGGFLIALLYIVLIFDLYFTLTGESVNSIALLFNPLGWLMAGIFGMIPGGIIGAVTGFAMRRLMRPAELPFSQDDKRRIQGKVYGITFLLSAIVILLFSMVMFPANGGLLLWGVPPILAGGVASYAAYRYLFRLVVLSNRKTRKSKAKNEAEKRDAKRLNQPQATDDTTADDILAMETVTISEKDALRS